MLQQVKIEMIGARERLVAESTLERFLSCVTSVVSGELVRATEGPVATFPRATERFLSSVDPTVRLEVGAFGVHLCAVRIVAAVHFLDFPVRSCSRSEFDSVESEGNQKLKDISLLIKHYLEPIATQ